MRFENLTPHQITVRWQSELAPVWRDTHADWSSDHIPTAATWEPVTGMVEPDPNDGVGLPITCELRIQPSGMVARLSTEREYVRAIGGIPCRRTTFGEPQGLPEPESGVVYVVSALILQACPDRDDLVAPGEAIRDEAGRIIACDGFSVL